MPREEGFEGPAVAVLDATRRFRTSCKAASIAGFAARCCFHCSLARLYKDISEEILAMKGMMNSPSAMEEQDRISNNP